MRTAEISRKTKETDITLALSLDGGSVSVSTGIGFFDHMLTAFAVHGGFGLTLNVRGDLEVDTHHTVEDSGIALGCAFKQALGDMGGIKRYGSFYIPMDECLVHCALDVSNRPFLVFNADFSEERCGDYETCCTQEFFRAFAVNAGVTLHLNELYGSNSHHITEALFKAFGHALGIAVSHSDGGILSTKGVL